MLVQKMQATQKGIVLEPLYIGFKSEDSYQVRIDAQRVQQIILNLQSNALKFTPNGGSVHIICQIVTEAQDLVHEEMTPCLEQAQHGLLQIQCRDTGLGISNADQQKLFKLFGYLTSTQQQNTKGIGLGLYISKMIAENFEGAIALRSSQDEKDHGTTFTFVIALEELAEEENGEDGSRCKNPTIYNYPKIKHIYKVTVKVDESSPEAFNLWSEVKESEEALPYLHSQNDMPDEIGRGPEDAPAPTKQQLFLNDINMEILEEENEDESSDESQSVEQSQSSIEAY